MCAYHFLSKYHQEELNWGLSGENLYKMMDFHIHSPPNSDRLISGIVTPNDLYNSVSLR